MASDIEDCNCHNNPECVEILPTVLLGLRSSIKEDIKASSAELLYGTTLRIPDKFFIDVQPTNQSRLFLERLRQTMRSIRPTPASHHHKNKPFYFNNLNKCSHVFVRVDSVKKPLEPPYEGPYQILQRITDKIFELDVNGKATTISTERLKPAYFEAPSSGQSPNTEPTSIQPALRTYPRAKKKPGYNWKRRKQSPEEDPRHELAEKSLKSRRESRDCCNEGGRACDLVKQDKDGEFERIQGSIDELTENLKETIEAREKFESEYYMVLKSANNLLRRGQSTKVVPLQAANQSSTVQSSSTQGLRINQTNIPGVRLPIIELPRFKGDLSDWLKFRDIYKSIIHDNPNISNIQKFHYLMSSLEGSATQVIDEYEYTEQNYEIVWEALHKCYNDPKLLIHNHIEAMFKSKPILNESSEQLNEIVDSITKHTRALKKLEEPTEHWDSLLIYLIVTKLDIDTVREWEEQRLKLAEKPKLEDLLKCLRARATLLQTIERKKGTIKTKKITPGKTSTLLTKKVSCAFCKGEHYIQNCSNFLKLSPQERSEKVKQLRLCTNCLRKGHYSECTFRACRKCNSKHNSLLHFERGDQSDTKESTAATMCAANHAKVFNEPNVILATALVGINNSNNFKEQTRALLDSCSQTNFISERLCKKLKLEKILIDVQVMSLNQAGPKINYKCEVEIVSRISGFRFKTVCLVIPKLVDDVMPNEAIPLNNVQIPSHLKLADPSFQTPGQVDLLIGAQWFWEILCVGQIKLSNNLIMQKTRLGWIIGGPMSAPAQKVVKCNILKNINLEQQLTKFWELEEAPITKAWSQEEKDCESYFVKTTRRDNDGRFIVSMPLKESPKVLGESRHQAKRRLINLEKRLKGTPELSSSYL
ncbi:uncharacterized protein LOC105202487 [Solenopsis invicta]|uniref:uncharacterized protein LOC105202487 n=1 Tax=Solenopsis invicta TaxID=13686 RepID=UPI00193DDE26|nr:uncharacterized protein LOC105202487 [Solenopsis invicta]